MTGPQPLTFGDIDNTDLPLAVAVHGFPDTPHTWRHLGPELAERGYRVVAPWLPGYDRPADGLVNVGTYVRHILATRQKYGGDDRTLLVGHDWGAISAYGAVNTTPAAFARLVALAAPPMMVMTEGLFGYRQLKRSFYVWFIQLVGIAEAVLAAPGFWESLWADWSPGYDANQGGSSIVYVLQAGARLVAGAVVKLARRGGRIEVRPAAEESFNTQLSADLEQTVWTRCGSYFRSPTGRIVTQWPYPAFEYTRRTWRVRRRDWLHQSTERSPSSRHPAEVVAR